MKVYDFSHLDEEMLAKVARLRIKGWETEAVRAAEQSDWLDKFERATLRWAVCRDGVPLAAARLSLHHGLAEVPDSESYAGVFTFSSETPIASPNRVVSPPSARGRGLSWPSCSIEFLEGADCFERALR
jgi:hypothetical protein